MKNLNDLIDEINNRVPSCVVDYMEIIDELYDNIPKKKSTKEYKNWRKVINTQIEACHKLTNYKIYNLIR